MKSPYYRIYIGNSSRDITEFVESMDYEDVIDEDNLIVLKIDQTFALKLADDDDFVTGNTIKFQFGFIGMDVSVLQEARITDIEHEYAERVSMTVKCLDLGTHVKKTTSQKIWENKTASSIAKSIAAKYGLKAVVEETKELWTNLPQGNRSDLDFLQYLAKRTGDGNFIVFIRNKELHFERRGLRKDSLVTFTYGDGDGILVSFRPSLKESGANPAGNQTASVRIDDKTGAVSKHQVDANDETATGTTGTYKLVYDANTGEVTGKIWEDNKVAGKPNLEPADTDDEAKALANSSKKSAILGVLTATLVVEGNPLLVPNSVVTIKGVAKRHLGNWFITKVTHKIQGQAYTTTCELSSNSAKTKASSKIKASDANKTEGSSEIDNSTGVKVNRYDANTGKRIE